MKTRSVSHLLYAHPVDMGGLPIRQPLPTQQVQQVDPFLLIHHADIKAPSTIDPDDAGVGPHPHRGFSPVTFIFKGGVHHRDSRGNNSTVYAGGAQWLNAGMGIFIAKDHHMIFMRLAVGKKLFSCGSIHLQDTKWISLLTFLFRRKTFHR